MILPVGIYLSGCLSTMRMVECGLTTSVVLGRAVRHSQDAFDFLIMMILCRGFGGDWP